MVLGLIATLFFAEPMPVDMPRAEAYMTKAEGKIYLEDRYLPLELWQSKAIVGRWMDDEERLFTLFRINRARPVLTADTMTRAEFDNTVGNIGYKDDDAQAATDAIRGLSPYEISDEFETPRHRLQAMEYARYYEGTNENLIVCHFLLRKAPYSYLVIWELDEDDDKEEMRNEFEEKLLSDWTGMVERNLPSERGLSREKMRGCGKSRFTVSDERILFRKDIANSIACYSSWRQTDAADFTIIDDLRQGRDSVSAISNELSLARQKYFAVLPTRVESTNTLAVVRIYANRGEYLSALGVNGKENMVWSAAYWDTSRRELAAYLPEEGFGKLRATLRHEAFHQYLSYGCSMLHASPWLNEGYAGYFENEEEVPQFPDCFSHDDILLCLEAIFYQDYSEFYAGDDRLRQLKYALARSIAYFLENGAPKVRFNPFGDVKKKYLDTLLETQDMHKATAAAFPGEEALRKFIVEWDKYFFPGGC